MPQVEREVLNSRKREDFRLCQSAAEVVERNMASELGVCYTERSEEVGAK